MFEIAAGLITIEVVVLVGWMGYKPISVGWDFLILFLVVSGSNYQNNVTE